MWEVLIVLIMLALIKKDLILSGALIRGSISVSPWREAGKIIAFNKYFFVHVRNLGD
jgi:hypothetical protein